MKLFYTMLSMLVLSIVFVSCSKDNAVSENQEDSVANMNMSTSNKARGINYYDATKTLSEDIGRDYPKLPLSQSDVDYYGDLVQYEGQLEEAQANVVVEHVTYAQEVGIRKYMDERMNYKEFTKQTIVRIVENGPIGDVEGSSEFQNLPKNERKVILAVNKIASDYVAGMRGAHRTTGNCTMNGQPAPCNLTHAVIGAGVGFMAGNALCGIPCGVGGAIIGGIIGWFSGGDDK